jgi:arginine:ornithine antiporter / lysine permease
VLYSIFLLYAAGLKYLLVACIVYAPGTLLYIWARREQGRRVFQPAEAVMCVGLVVAATVGIVLIPTGYLTL